jgi:hypothetical protein
MAEDASAHDDHFYRAVAGITLTIPPDRPDLLLVELKTVQGPLRFAMPQDIALQVAGAIGQKAKELKV